ncbi:hypothetical protein AK88_02195 [Plasmodium fragile]|uniref:Uncharacterized protein n=1 Tax=Plasmodium fragile TaxID=5857 RepID=A0A0D9QQZ6_PLAFR|nr:uncharacterized protein AK88_02195 [Plasmodium fragile]KJP88081.1 hypothetical protein AK88_02195 [Plasmodium fragile]
MFSKRKVVKRNIRKVTGDDASNLNGPPNDEGKENSTQEETTVGRRISEVCVAQGEVVVPPVPEGGSATQEDDMHVREPPDEEKHEEEVYGRRVPQMESDSNGYCTNGKGSEEEEEESNHHQVEKRKGSDERTSLHPLLPHSQFQSASTHTQEATTKKGKGSRREMKKNEETRKVNKMNTSFHIYSDEENDCYVAIRKRKNVKRGIQSGSIQNASIHMGDSPDMVQAAKDVKDNPVDSDAELREPLPGGVSERDFFLRRYGVDLHQGGVNRTGQQQLLHDEEGNNLSNFEEGQTNIRTYTSTQRNETAPMEKNVFVYDPDEERYEDNPVDMNSLGGDPNENKYSYNKRERYAREEDHVEAHDTGERYPHVAVHRGEAGGKEDEEDYQDEEEKKLIERIKLKKQILRKKKKLSDRYSYLLEEDHEGGDPAGIDFSLGMTAQQLGGKNKMAAMWEGDDSPREEDLPGEDDLDVDDIYNYESLSEMKNRLIIKKNKSEEVNMFYGVVGGGETTERGHPHQIGSSTREYIKQMQEDEMINKIVDTKIISQLRREKRGLQQQGIFTPPDEGGTTDPLFDERSKQSDDQAELNLKKHSLHGDRFPVPRHDVPTANDTEGKKLNEQQKREQNGEEEEREKGRNVNFLKMEKRLNHDNYMDEEDWRNNAQSNDRAYQHENEILFSEIKRTFKKYGVCNTQLVEMYEYILDLFEEYKFLKDESGQVKSLEKNYKKKYMELEEIKRKRTKELVTCASFFRFFYHVMKFINAKSNLLDNALAESFEMDVTFFIVYQNLKLYLYREYYENYKLLFTKDYIYNSKYYKRKKEEDKNGLVKELVSDGVVPNCHYVHGSAPFIEHLINEVNHPNRFNDMRVHYMFDGYSSNYSTDSSSSDSGEATSDVMKNDQEHVERREQKRKEDKQKYFQTCKIKALKRRYLVAIGNIFKDVHSYFLNFKNAITYFYLLKLHNEDFYLTHNCKSLFDPIFFFFIKYELLFWDPLYQFTQTRNKKRKLLALIEEQIMGSQSEQMHDKFVQLYRNDAFANAHNILRRKKQVLSPGRNWTFADDTANSSYEVDEAASSVDGFRKDPSTENEIEHSTHSSESEDAFSFTSSSAAQGEISSLLEKSPMGEKSPIAYKSPMGEKSPIAYKSPMGEKSPIAYKSPMGEKSPTADKTPLEKTKKKYKPPKNHFHNNPSVKTFQWYKFMDELMYIYQVEDEKEVLKKVYDQIFNNKVHELVEAWNPLSLKQSYNLCVILAEYLLYNEDRTQVTDMVKEKINNCVFTFFEGYKNISSQKKKNIVLMRCLKILKSVRGILSLLSDDALHDFVKKIFYNFVLTNYDYSSKLHNLIVSAVVHIILSMGVPQESKFFEDMSSVLCGITDRMHSGDFDYGKFKVEN